MKNLPEDLRYIAAVMAAGGVFTKADGETLHKAASELERLQTIAGAVSPGQSVADIKEYLRGVKQQQDAILASREADAN